MDMYWPIQLMGMGYVYYLCTATTTSRLASFVHCNFYEFYLLVYYAEIELYVAIYNAQIFFCERQRS